MGTDMPRSEILVTEFKENCKELIVGFMHEENKKMFIFYKEDHLDIKKEIHRWNRQ